MSKLSKNPDARRELGVRYLDRKNSSYEFRAMTQLELWRRGMPVHNDIDDECCPDFSCCRGRQHMASEKLRDMFVRDPMSRRAMMEMFIAELPDELRILYDIPGQIVMRVEQKH